MFTFDLTTTAINNYIDTKTNEQILPFSRRAAFLIILLLFAVSAAAGILLVLFTDIVVLVVGALCFLCGILYTGGPVPISRQPLGELLSGIFYGLFIPFLILYINMPTGTFFDLGADAQTVRVTPPAVRLPGLRDGQHHAGKQYLRRGKGRRRQAVHAPVLSGQ